MNPPSPLPMELRRGLAAKEYANLKRILHGTASADLAKAWGGFTPFERVVLFKLISVDRAESFFNELDLPAQSHLLSTLERGALGPVLEEAPASLFHSLPDSIVERLICRASRCR